MRREETRHASAQRGKGNCIREGQGAVDRNPHAFHLVRRDRRGELRKSVDYYIEALAVDGIFCGGVMGEFWSMTVEERARVHELVVGAAAGRVPVMVHIGHHNYSEAAQLSRHAEQIGAAFVIAINPYFPIKPSDDIVRDWFRRLTGESSVPFFLFNTSYSGYALSPELIAELSDLETVCGIKNPKPRDHLLRVQDLVGDKIVVCDADEADWLSLHLDHGFQSLMSTPALAMYQTPDHRPIHDYTRLADAGDIEGAWAIHGTLRAGARCIRAMDAGKLAGPRRGGNPHSRAQDLARSDGPAPRSGAAPADPAQRRAHWRRCVPSSMVWVCSIRFPDPTGSATTRRRSS